MGTNQKVSKKISGQTQQQPGDEHEMSPQPVIIRDNYKGSDKLLNKVALITGDDSGIGRSIGVQCYHFFHAIGFR